jgi:hypothetical protein
MGGGGEEWASYSSCFTGVMLHSSINYQQEKIYLQSHVSYKPRAKLLVVLLSVRFQDVSNL